MKISIDEMLDKIINNNLSRTDEIESVKSLIQTLLEEQRKQDYYKWVYDGTKRITIEDSPLVTEIGE